jgi:stage V sporulation protein D (sporulation-specific penicillin-binding protein)
VASRKRGVNWRLGAVVALIALTAMALVARLVQLQIVDHERYAAEARNIHVAQETVTGRRGALLDRNGYPLAASKDTYDVMAEVKAWDDPVEANRAAAAIAAVTGGDPEEMVAAVRGASIYEIAVVRSLGYEEASRVRDLDLPGVRLLRSSARLYPEGNLAAQLIGFVGRDNVGLTGLEADLEGIIGGARGTVVFERDGLGNQIAFGARSELPPLPGSDVALTIDRFIQRLAEQELDRAVNQHEAAGGTIIVVQPETGEILAMASRPTFDLGLVSPDTWWYDEGVFRSGGWTIRNWDLSANGDQTVTQILAKSLNTGAAWLAHLVGSERYYDYVHRFGFGEPTGSGLGGEVGGRVRTPDNDPDGWRPVDMATNSFGQGISVTALQMAMAVAAIANDGKLMKPMLVKEVIGPNGSQAAEPEVVGQVISPDTARTLLGIMGVVVQGIPASSLNVQGYTVAGKSGTANIASGDGGYKDTAYISSFIGAVPLEDPQLLVMVKIDEPKGVPWGTVVAAPAFERIAQAALAYFKIPPQEPALVSEIR